jgi:hypothetical protein
LSNLLDCLPSRVTSALHLEYITPLNGTTLKFIL